MPRSALYACLMLVSLCAAIACDEPPRRHSVTSEGAHADDEGKFGKRAPEENKPRLSGNSKGSKRAAHGAIPANRAPLLKALGQESKTGDVRAMADFGGVGVRGQGPGGGGGLDRVGTRGRGAGDAAYGIGAGGLGSEIKGSLGGLRGASYGGSSGSLGLGGVGYGRASVNVGGDGPALRERAAVVERKAPAAGGRFVHEGTNPFTSASEDRHSTFAVDVDTGSYAFARAFLERGSRPPASSVRVEEWINANRYDYAGPSDGEGAFRVHLAAGPSPFTGDKHLLRVALQGRRISARERKATHLSFLVDVSGSMNTPDKLPLVRESLHLLVDHLRDDDTVALVTYAGDTKVVLSSTSATNKDAIHAAIDTLKPGGGTAMGSGMELAYRQAALRLSDDRMSRVVVLSDGDANIGRTSHKAILDAVRGWVSEGVTLSTIGFGRGNYNDHLMEGLADAGNGNYTYLDSRESARRFFQRDLVAMLQVIAKDVKVQLEMNPDVVRGYRLIGYENRDVADKDFANDKIDGGEIGAGHAVTALYELDLVAGARGDLATVRVRAKEPRGLRSSESVARLGSADVLTSFERLDEDTRFATGVALAAEVLRGSPYVSHLSLSDATTILAGALTGPHAKERSFLLSALRKVVEAERALARR